MQNTTILLFPITAQYHFHYSLARMHLPREIGEFCEYLESNIKLFFETNDNENTSPTLLLEAFKAYLRGHIISFQSSLKKRNKAKQLELQEEIHQLDMGNALRPSLEKHTKISTLKFKLKILSDRICRAFIFTKQLYLNSVISHTNY